MGFEQSLKSNNFLHMFFELLIYPMWVKKIIIFLIRGIVKEIIDACINANMRVMLRNVKMQNA